MKKILFFLLSFCPFALLNAQNNIMVEYKLNDNVINRIIITDTATHSETRFAEEHDTGLDVTKDSKMFMIKHYKQQAIYFRPFRFFQREFYVKDSLHPMKWKFTKEKKEILGYKCKSATTTFRGRNYVAFYTEKIPISEGPFKFGGLPGLILEIYSLDDEFKWLAIKYETQTSHKPKNNVNLNDYKFMSWQEYVDEYKKTVDRAVERMKADEPPGYSGGIKKTTIEIYYPEYQTGKGIRW